EAPPRPSGRRGRISERPQRTELTTLPLQSRPNASPFWIMLLLSLAGLEHSVISMGAHRLIEVHRPFILIVELLRRWQLLQPLRRKWRKNLPRKSKQALARRTKLLKLKLAPLHRHPRLSLPHRAMQSLTKRALSFISRLLQRQKFVLARSMTSSAGRSSRPSP